MSHRELVIQHVTERMTQAFVKGDIIDAQNMHAFVLRLEEMTDEEYLEYQAAAEIAEAV